MKGLEHEAVCFPLVQEFPLALRMIDIAEIYIMLTKRIYLLKSVLRKYR